jgi:hypothetical protein
MELTDAGIGVVGADVGSLTLPEQSGQDDVSKGLSQHSRIG